MTPEIINALVVLLRNQGRLADMIANPRNLDRRELQDSANRIGLDAARAANALEGTGPRQEVGQ